MSELNIKYDKKNVIIIILCIVIVIGIVALIFFLKAKPKEQPQPTVTTVEKHDTSYIPQPAVTLPQVQPIIIKSDPATPIVIPPQYQNNSTDIKELTAQVKELAAQFYAVNHYKDSVLLKDSSGKRVGIVNLEQDVSENKIQALRPSYRLQFPTITNSYEKTITVPAAIKNQWFYGAGVSLDQTGTFRGLDAGISVVNKRGQMLQLGPAVFPGFKVGGRIGFGKRF